MSNDATTKGWTVPPTVSPTEVVSAFRDWLGSADVARLTSAEHIELIGLLEASKGASAALQARVTAAFVADRDAEVADRVSRGDIDQRAAGQQRAAARSEVALARRCSPSQADRHVGLAKALVAELPETMGLP